MIRAARCGLVLFFSLWVESAAAVVFNPASGIELPTHVIICQNKCLYVINTEYIRKYYISSKNRAVSVNIMLPFEYSLFTVPIKMVFECPRLAVFEDCFTHICIRFHICPIWPDGVMSFIVNPGYRK